MAAPLDPVVSYNLASIVSQTTSMPFIDIMKQAKPWIGSTSLSYAASMSFSSILADGCLDSDGWPTRLPTGMTSICTIWEWGNGTAESVDGSTYWADTYIMTYEGQADFYFGVGAVATTIGAGRISIANANGRTMTMVIANINESNPPKNIKIFKQDYEVLIDNGEIFNPDWIAEIENAREVRFMKWMQVDAAVGTTDWASRPGADDFAYTWRGVPVETCVALCNQIGADAYICMPHLSTSDYWSNCATYVKANLDADLLCFVEWANEIWNTGTYPWLYTYLKGLALADWGDDTGTIWLEYGGKISTECMIAWETVYGAETSTRLRRVLGTQTGQYGFIYYSGEAPTWLSNDAINYVAPHTKHDLVGVTTYFGGDAIKLEIDNLIAAIEDPEVDEQLWLYDYLHDETKYRTLPEIASLFDGLIDLCLTNGYDLDLYLYEGGQHLLYSYNGLTQGQKDIIFPVLATFIRSDYMATVYEEMYDIWAAVGSGPFCQFTEVQARDSAGAWGQLAYLGDTTPRATAVNALNNTEASFFGGGGGVQYLSRIVTILSGGGSHRQQFNAKGGFVAGDASGHNAIRIPGAPSDYTISKSGTTVTYTHDTSGAVTKTKDCQVVAFIG